MPPCRPPVSHRFALGAAVLALAAFAPGAATAAAGTFALPGRVSGAVHQHGNAWGTSATWVAVKYGVHPVRVSRSGDGGLRVDARRVTPRFPAGVNGLVLNVPECRVYLVHQGAVERDYPVAVSAPDKPVPIGLTQVVSKQKNPTWFVPASIQKEMAKNGQRVKTKVAPGPRNPLGPRWIGFWNGSFGMHGTNAPSSIGHYASHGCVRFREADIKDLYDRVWIGTPIRVVYQPVLLAADQGSVFMSAYPDIYKSGYDYRGAVRALASQAGVLGSVDWGRANAAIGRKDGILRDVGPGHGVVPVQYEAGGERYDPGPPIPDPLDPETGLTESQMQDLPSTVYQDGGPPPDPWYTAP